MSFTDLADASDDGDSDNDQPTALAADTASNASGIPSGDADLDGAGGPGYAIPGWPGHRAGVPGSTQGALMLAKADGSPSPGQGATAKDYDPYPLPKAYSYDAQGRLQVNPEFARTHPGGLPHDVNWPGVAADLGKIAIGSVGGSGSIPSAWAIARAVAGVAGAGLATWKMQEGANRKGAPPSGATDRAADGRP